MAVSENEHTGLRHTHLMSRAADCFHTYVCRAEAAEVLGRSRQSPAAPGKTLSLPPTRAPCLSIPQLSFCLVLSGVSRFHVHCCYILDTFLQFPNFCTKGQFGCDDCRIFPGQNAKQDLNQPINSADESHINIECISLVFCA